ncbi:MAG: hypothetical protein V3S34_04905 [Hyphomicrobium sp.]
MTDLVTPRFRLRAFHDGDLARMVEAIDDWAVSQWLDTPPIPTGKRTAGPGSRRSARTMPAGGRG